MYITWIVQIGRNTRKMKIKNMNTHTWQKKCTQYEKQNRNIKPKKMNIHNLTKHLLENKCSYCVHFFLSCVCVHLFFIFIFPVFLPICTIHVMYIYSVGVSNRCQVWTSALRTLQTGQVMAHISFSISFLFLLFFIFHQKCLPGNIVGPNHKDFTGSL